VPDRQAWRAWLDRHHATEQAVWLVLPKKRSTYQGPSYDDAVEEALCFGWVDSRTRRLDEECTLICFTPRKARSNWSASNRARVEKLERAGLMREAGRLAVQAAKANGRWQPEEVSDTF
jgi:uncharacterized protein YdeI (YjbR/CyaY-like superfamily)